MNKFRRLGERFKSAMQGGTADNQLNKLVLPSNVTSELANITPEAGLIAYDTTLQKVVFNDGADFVALNDAADAGMNQLTGDVVAGPGNGSQVATIPNDTVTFAKMQNISTNKLLGRGTAGTGDIEQITLGTNLSLTGTTLNAASPTLPLTTKGDLFGFSTVNARVPIGTDGQILTADSTQALGLKWAAASGANVTLSNLSSPTEINQDLLPSITDTFNLGSSPLGRWDLGYINELSVKRVYGQDIHGDAYELLTPDATGTDDSNIASLRSGTVEDGTSGEVFIATGNATTGASGPLVLSSGDSLDSANTGPITINSGNALDPDAGTTGLITMKTGDSLWNSGSIIISSGNAAANSGSGSVNITSGLATEDDINTGAINISSGNATGTGESGNISLSTGATGTGARGKITMSALSLALPQQDADPAGVAGDIYYNSMSNKIRWYNGTTWADL